MLLAGILMIVLPGPAFVFIPAGLAILATEFAWARRWLVWVRKKIADLRDKAKAKKTARDEKKSEKAA